MWWVLLLLVGVWAKGGTESQYGTDEENQAIVDSVNRAQSDWHANLNSRFAKAKDEDLAVFAGLKDDEEIAVGGYGGRPTDLDDESIAIPENFDAREQWPECKSIGYIRDQGPCGGCWAVDVSSMASDRYCIQMGGKENPDFSYLELLACSGGGGCHGGSDSRAMDYIIQNGITTGRQMEDGQDTCMPSTFKLCNHHQYGAYDICIDSDLVTTPECPNKCTGTEYTGSFEKDRYYGRDVWDLYGAEQMQREILLRGPIVVSFHVWKDFYFYEKGVYSFVTGPTIGRHAVRMIGWGVDNGLKYWIITNTWNDNWGEGGVIRINRDDPKVPITSGYAFRMKTPSPSTEPGYAMIENDDFQAFVVYDTNFDFVDIAVYALALVGVAALIYLASRFFVQKRKPLTGNETTVKYSGVAQEA